MSPHRRPVDEPAVPARWLAALDLWEDHATVAGFAAATRKVRRRYLERIVIAGDLRDPWAVATGDLERALAAAGLPAISTRDARGALRAFYAWALAAGRIGHDPARTLTAVTVPCLPAQRDPQHTPAWKGRGAATYPPLTGAWAAAVEAWRDYKLAGGQSAASLRTQRHYLTRFAQSCPDPWAATSDLLLHELAEPAWAPNTRKSARGALRSFYAWATLFGHMPADPSRVLPAVRVPAAAPRPTPDDVITAARAKATGRERLMLDLALLAGLRRAEIARVHTSDIEGDNLRVHGKGGRQRLVPLHPDLVAQLRHVPPGGYVFATATGQPPAPDTVGGVLDALLGPGWTGHTLRHAAGTRWYAQTGDVLVVAKLLGHAKPETSAIYVQVPDEIARRAVDSCR